MPRNKKIALFVIEEHHEAFVAWHYASQKDMMHATGNSLVHVDEHADMSPARFVAALPGRFGRSAEMADVKDLAFRELCIDTFISAAIYSGTFDRVQWIRQKHQTSRLNQCLPMYIRSYNNAGKKLVLGHKLDEALHNGLSGQTDIRYFEYRLGHTGDMRESGDTLLDIDLDFFSCTGHPNKQNPLRIETTECEAEQFNGQPYHPMRFWFSKVETVRVGEKYYYLINNYDDIYSEDTYVPLETIDRRIDQFVEALDRNGLDPQVVTVCRSRYSGFTPADQWQHIETRLIGGLESLFDLEVYPAGCL